MEFQSQNLESVDNANMIMMNLKRYKNTICMYDKNGNLIQEFPSRRHVRISTGTKVYMQNENWDGLQNKGFLYLYKKDVSFERDNIQSFLKRLKCGSRKRPGRVFHFSSDGQLVSVHENMYNAGRETGYFPSQIKRSCVYKKWLNEDSLFQYEDCFPTDEYGTIPPVIPYPTYKIYVVSRNGEVMGRFESTEIALEVIGCSISLLEEWCEKKALIANKLYVLHLNDFQSVEDMVLFVRANTKRVTEEQKEQKKKEKDAVERRIFEERRIRREKREDARQKRREEQGRIRAQMLEVNRKTLEEKERILSSHPQKIIKGRTIAQFYISGELIKIHEDLNTASSETGVPPEIILRCCLNFQESEKNCFFVYDKSFINEEHMHNIIRSKARKAQLNSQELNRHQDSNSIS
ncbi:hypothetical protein [Rossellomorea marisflavi]|uniref:hypothetical protein n=1 Tax=Rossellomorea marisflavi TaxID=189381 RepID=UPI003F9FB5BC